MKNTNDAGAQRSMERSAINRPEPYRAEDFNEYLRRLGHGKETRQQENKEALRFTGWLAKENIPLREAGYNDVTAYINLCIKAGNAPRTLAIKANHIKHYYDFLRGGGEVTDNPASNIEIKGIKRIRLYHTHTPEELENIYRTFRDTIPEEADETQKAVHLRDRCMVRLCTTQGISIQETGNLTPGDIVPGEGKIKIPGTRRSNGRELLLDAAQLHELTGYMYEARPRLSALSGTAARALFFPHGGGTGLNNVAYKIIAGLKKQNPGLTDIKQIRASVISNWLKAYDIRKVQYMAGHRYVSSTERYKANDMEGLINEVERCHPLG